VVVLLLLLSHSFVLATLCFVFIGATDWLDGWLARSFAWQSRLGSLLDPLADKLLVFLTCLGLALTNLIPWWFFYLTTSRDILLVSGSLVILRQKWPVSLKPSFLSKTNTTLQLFLLLERLASPFTLSFIPTCLLFENNLVYLVAITTITSGIEYMWRFYRQISNQPSKASTKHNKFL
jgi:cardiolipin synthase